MTKHYLLMETFSASDFLRVPRGDYLNRSAHFLYKHCPCLNNAVTLQIERDDSGVSANSGSTLPKVPWLIEIKTRPNHSNSDNAGPDPLKARQSVLPTPTCSSPCLRAIIIER